MMMMMKVSLLGLMGVVSKTSMGVARADDGAADNATIDGTEIVSDTCERACPGARAMGMAAVMADVDIKAAIGAAIAAGNVSAFNETAQEEMYGMKFVEKLPGFCPHQIGLECMVKHLDCDASPEAVALVDPLTAFCGALVNGSDFVSDTCEAACPGARIFAVAANKASSDITADMNIAIQAGQLDFTNATAMEMYGGMKSMEKLPGMCPHQRGLECMAMSALCEVEDEARALVEPLRMICGNVSNTGGGCTMISRTVLQAVRAKGLKPKMCAEN